MKGVVITPDFDVTIEDFSTPLHTSVGNTVGGYIEHVKPIGLKEPLCMIVDDEGLLKNRPFNPIASSLYGFQFHGHPIVGVAVIMKDEYVNGGRDIVGLSDDEASRIHKEFSEIAKPFKQMMKHMKGDTQ